MCCQDTVRLPLFQTYEHPNLAHKGDIIDICVYSINSEMIRGKLGAAEVMIPKQRMGCLTYNEC